MNLLVGLYRQRSCCYNHNNTIILVEYVPVELDKRAITQYLIVISECIKRCAILDTQHAENNVLKPNIRAKQNFKPDKFIAGILEGKTGIFSCNNIAKRAKMDIAGILEMYTKIVYKGELPNERQSYFY